MSYRTLHRGSRHLTRVRSIFRAGLAVAALTAAGAAEAQDFVLTNIQPVDVQSIEGLAYDPTDPTGTIWFEPMMRDSATTPPSYRLNLDLEIKNDTPDWQRLDSVEVDYLGTGAASLQLVGDNLVRYDSTYYVYGSGSNTKRGVIGNGGFGSSGLIIQRNLIEDDMKYGTARDVETYTVPGFGTRIAVAGERRTLIGDPPEVEGDPYTLDRQPVLALFDAGGSLLDTRDSMGQQLNLIEDLGDGRFLVAGKNGDASIFIQRLFLYDFDQDGAAIDANEINLDETFSGDGTLTMSFDGCEVSAPVGLESTATDAGMRYTVAVPLLCGDGERTGIAMMNSNGALVSEFGDWGKMILTGPNDEPTKPGGLAPVVVDDLGDGVAWLAATAGEGCFEGDYSACIFALARLTLDAQEGGLEWTEVEFDDATYADVNAIDVDIEGRPVLAGNVTVDETSRAALVRFTYEGDLDYTFGLADNGVSLAEIGAESTVVNDVIVTADQNYWTALRLGYDTGISGIDYTFGVAAFNGSDGSLAWSYDAGFNGEWEHRIVPNHLNYGSIFEADPTGIAWALEEDGFGRVMVVGHVISDHADFVPDKWYGGPTTMALARFLPSGSPESRRWLAPGSKMKLRIPEDRDFDPAPTDVSIKFDFLGGTIVDLQVDRSAQPLWSNAVITNPVAGSYLMPFRHTELNFNEAVTVGAHHLWHHHRHSEGNRFAYDLGIARWNGAKWTGVEAGGDPDVIEDRRSWNVPVVAMASGEVVSCRRSSVDNPLGGRDGDANFVKVQHAFDAVDKLEREYVSYVHLKEESIPEDVCPLICPEDDPDCNPEFDGVDPDGREIPEALRPSVSAGQTIGRVGNTGNSGSPHLHIHVETGAGGEPGDPYQGNIPLLFQNVMIANRYNPAGDEINPTDWYSINNMAIPSAYLAIPLP